MVRVRQREQELLAADGDVNALRSLDASERLARPVTVCFTKDLPIYRGKMILRSPAVLFRNFGRSEGVLASLNVGWNL